MVNCDEFPFASTEEGGDWYGINPTTPTGTVRTYVPRHQNDMQGGFCHGM